MSGEGLETVLFLLVAVFGTGFFVTLVVVVLIARRERRLRGWQGDALQRIDSAQRALVAAQRCVLRGDYFAMMDLVAEAGEELGEVNELARRYEIEVRRFEDGGDGSTRPVFDHVRGWRDLGGDRGGPTDDPGGGSDSRTE